MKPNPICFTKQKFKFEEEGEREILVESRTLVEKILNQNLREILFSNFQIGFTNKGLIFKASCMELGTPHETQPFLFYQQKFRFEEGGEGEI